ncbi:MAG TPA: hypothetical protein VFR08_07985 [Candidatus Angelobacter sp.]|nr:hypothetical protein [Candidatus Angelobacter sp.]
MVGYVLVPQAPDAKDAEKNEEKARNLKPEGVKGASEGDRNGFSAGQDRPQKTVFLLDIL